jgi:fermentation-respiration switch protein FrsA (DUF1100 family)
LSSSQRWDAGAFTSLMKVKRAVIIGVVMIALLTFISIWIAGGLLTAPANQPIGNLPTELPVESVQFSSESGSTIHGWFIPGHKQGGAVVLMHGVRSNRTSMLERARFLSHAGYAILLFDFQAHGESPGKQITFGYLESRDARAAVSFLRSRDPGESIGVIGVSMGGAAALLATPPLEADALVLEMVYPTIDQAIEDRLAIRLGKLGSAIAPLLSWQIKPRLGIRTADLRPIDKVKSVHVPKLFIAGEKDMHTRIEESRAIFAAAAEPKDLWVVAGAEHEDLLGFGGKEYERRVLLFFERYLRSSPPQVMKPPAAIP